MVHNLVYESLTEKDIFEIEQRAQYLIKQLTVPVYDYAGFIWIEATCWYLENKKGIKLPEEGP